MLTRARRRPGAAPIADASAPVAFTPSVQTVGWIVDVDAAGRARVDFAGNCAGPLPARSLQRCSAAELAAAGERPAVWLAFEGIDTSRPVILGLLQDRLVEHPAPAAPATAPAAAPTRLPRTARGGGRRVELNAEDELELRCGRARITLRADGSIVIQGGEVQSRASGRNRITGSTVAIN